MSGLVANARRLPPRAILCGAWLVGLVYAYPGYMNYDVADQLIQLRDRDVNDYHPPLLAGYWRLLEIFVTGPIGLLLLQSVLFLYGVYALLRQRLSERAAAWLAAAIALFPPILTPMAGVWKDAQMAAFLVAGTALALQPARRRRAIGIALLALAAGVRYNGGAALPFLLLCVVSMWGVRRIWLRFAVVVALLAATYVPATFANHLLTKSHTYNWYRTTAMFDLTGIACYAPPLSDAEVRRLFAGIPIKDAANLQDGFCRRFPPGTRTSWYGYADVFDWNPVPKAERLARGAAWRRMVERYPGAYLHERGLLARDLLGMMPDVPLWEPVGQDSLTPEQRQQIGYERKHAAVQDALGDAFRWLAAHTPLYRAWLYAALSILLAAWAAWRRDLLVGCLVGSGLLYELGVVAFANAPDFRYSHWLIVCTCLGGVLAAVAERARRRASHG